MSRVTRGGILALAIALVAPQVWAGHWSLAFWRSLNKEENASNLFVRVWTFDENGNVVGNVPITTPTGTLLVTTDSSGRGDFPMNTANEYQCRVSRAGDSSDITPYMSNGRYPEWGHYSYELGFMYKSNVNNPGVFDLSIVGGDVPRRGGTSYNSPVTASMAFHSFNPWVWDSDVGARVLPSGGWGEHGQTFYPNGNRVVCVQFHPTVGGVNVPMTFTVEIRQGGPDGPVIASRTSSVHYNQDWWVVPFGTSACPVVPGQVYFARVYTSGGFNAYYMNTDFYPNGLARGQAYWRPNSTSPWQIASNPDLKGFIVCCDYDQTPPVFVNNVTASPLAGSAVISWTTDVPSTSRVDFGLTGSYGRTVYDPSPVTNHSVTIGPLRADTTYNYRVVSTAPGYQDGYSTNRTFMTASATPNLLVNGGFNTGQLTPWVKWGQFSNHVRSDGIGPWCVDICPWDDPPYDFISVTSYGTQNGGAYQRVTGVRPGSTYTARMLYYTRQQGGADSDVANQLGIDPYGGTSPYSPSIVWTPELSSQATWTTASVSAVASGTAVTVFLKAIQKWALQWNINAFDDVRLTGPIVGDIPAVKWQPDGARVRLSGKIVTATAAQVGAFYIQEPDRRSGIRVEAISGTAAVGSVVDVEGWMAESDGERFIFDASITPAGSVSVRPLGMLNRSLGGADFNTQARGVDAGLGPNNVGLLVTAFGRVVSTGEGFFLISDGSGEPLRVNSAASSTLPNVGDFVSVTGICRAVSIGGARKPCLVLRQTSDWRRIE